jgi:hypothetical protein
MEGFDHKRLFVFAARRNYLWTSFPREYIISLAASNKVELDFPFAYP